MKYFSKELLLFYFLMAVLYANGQQLSLQSQYFINPMIVNPAATGIEESPMVMGNFRKQWVGFSGAPETVSFVGQMRLSENFKLEDSVEITTNYHGFGAYIVNDRIGPTSFTTASLAYSYNQRIAKNLMVSVGAFGGISQYMLDAEYLDMETDISNDPLVNDGNRSILSPNLAVGMLFNNPKVWFAGLSLFQGYPENIMNNGDFNRFETNNLNHWFLYTGRILKVDKYYTLVPTLFLRYVPGTHPQPDIGLSGIVNLKEINPTFDGKAFISFIARYYSSFSTFLGLRHKNYQIGYGFDFNTIAARGVVDYFNTGSQLWFLNSAGSHEISLAIYFNKK